MPLYTYTQNQCPHQVLTSYTLQFLRYNPETIFQTQGHYDKVKGQIKVTPWHCTPAPTNQLFLLSFNFLHLVVSEIQPTHSSGRNGWKQYHTAVNGCGVKTKSNFHPLTTLIYGILCASLAENQKISFLVALFFRGRLKRRFMHYLY